MNSAGKCAVLALLVISIAGCAEKKAKPIQPAQAQAPSTDAGKAGAMYPPPLTAEQPQATEPAPAPAPQVAQTQPPAQPEPPPATTKKPPATRKTKPSAAKPAAPTGEGAESSAPGSSTPAPAAPPAATESTSTVATNGEPAPASPIGQLSTGDVAGQGQTRKDTVDLIANTESGLNGIKRTLSAPEQETANQIKAFLAKAKQALSNDDLDGAFTLATKAKVLLDELTKA